MVIPQRAATPSLQPPPGRHHLPGALGPPIVSVVLVADLGGTSLRVGLVDGNGTIVAARTIIRRERPDRLQASEIDPQIWWQDFADAVEALARAEPDAFSGIAAVAISAVSRTQVFLAGAGQVLRPAILWSDARAEPLMQDLLGRCPPDHPEAGRLNAFHPLARLWWLHWTEPETARAVASVVEPKDFLVKQHGGSLSRQSLGSSPNSRSYCRGRAEDNSPHSSTYGPAPNGSC
jgi:sugar (pentulose or hexulose) kinase